MAARSPAASAGTSITVDGGRAPRGSIRRSPRGDARVHFSSRLLAYGRSRTRIRGKPVEVGAPCPVPRHGAFVGA